MPSKKLVETADEQAHMRVLRDEATLLSWNEKLDHWKGCFCTRMNSLKTIRDGETPKQIVDLWPMYNAEYGYRLVNCNHYSIYRFSILLFKLYFLFGFEYVGGV